jgi:DNA-binding NarL/FixJ family response regulator
MVTVRIVDSCPVFVRGLVEILAGGGIQVGAAEPVPKETSAARFDVTLLDPMMAEGVALDEFVVEASKEAPVLLVVDEHLVSTLGRLVGVGAAGVVSRRASADAMLEAVRAVAAGDRYPAPPADVAPTEDGTDSALSAREHQVLRHIAGGLTHRQVARTLGISQHTVDTYVKRIRVKLGVGNKAELTRAAMSGSPLEPFGGVLPVD